MGVRILEGNGEGDSRGAVLYCSVTDWAFGPVFEDGEQAQAFLDWLVYDPRSLSDSLMEAKYSEFLIHCDESKNEATPVE